MFHSLASPRGGMARSHCSLPAMVAPPPPPTLHAPSPRGRLGCTSYQSCCCYFFTYRILRGANKQIRDVVWSCKSFLEFNTPRFTMKCQNVKISQSYFFHGLLYFAKGSGRKNTCLGSSEFLWLTLRKWSKVDDPAKICKRLFCCLTLYKYILVDIF